MGHTHFPGVADLFVLTGDKGGDSGSARGADLFIEVPHGATAAQDFHDYAAAMTGPLPEGLLDFFFVNTDVGAFELAMAAAQRFVDAHPGTTAEVLRCRVPRTFIDTNRCIEADPADFKAGKVTPGVMPWVATAEDRQRLKTRYDAYQDLADERLQTLGSHSAVLLLHTYSPRTVGVEVDADIVKSLRWAYQPEVYETWPLRPEFDVITRGLNDEDFAPPLILDALRDGIEALGWPLHESATYPLHPSTMAYRRVTGHSGPTLCLEVRRDLLADPFDPFVEMRISPEKVRLLADPIARALAAHGVSS